jgi:hypothetical protein
MRLIFYIGEILFPDLHRDRLRGDQNSELISCPPAGLASKTF